MMGLYNFLIVSAQNCLVMGKENYRFLRWKWSFRNQLLQSYFTSEKLQIPNALSLKLKTFAWERGVRDFHVDVFFGKILIFFKILFNFKIFFKTILTGEKLYVTQFSKWMAAWLLLTFFICLHNQLSSVNSIITY